MARICLALLLLLPCGATPATHTVLAATPLSRMDLRWWRQRFEFKQDELHKNRGVELLFLGDSITEDYEVSGPPAWRDFVPVWQHYYGDRNAINLGFSGDATSHLLWRIENGETDGIAPKVAVVLIGANNLGRLHWSADDTVAGIDAIVTQLHHRLPRTKLLLLGVLPSDRSAWASETTVTINHMLAARYGRSDVTYLDIGAVFMQDGRLNRELFFDPKLTPPQAPLHPTAQGQALMAAAIEPTLAALLGDRQRSLPARLVSAKLAPVTQ
ncbi:MAG TPA: GDSL-type esterase/lipase family protein [Acetobacteraceae bacterium]